MTFSEFLYEMAFPQSKALQKIEELLSQLSIHFLKCWIIPNSRNYNHWRGEIINFLGRINDYSRVKTKRGLIDRKNFDKEYKHTLELPWVDNLVDSVCLQYDIEREQGDTEHFAYILKRFYEDLWDMLSVGGFNLRQMLQHLPK